MWCCLFRSSVDLHCSKWPEANVMKTLALEQLEVLKYPNYLLKLCNVASHNPKLRYFSTSSLSGKFCSSTSVFIKLVPYKHRVDIFYWRKPRRNYFYMFDKCFSNQTQSMFYVFLYSLFSYLKRLSVIDRDYYYYYFIANATLF